MSAKKKPSLKNGSDSVVSMPSCQQRIFVKSASESSTNTERKIANYIQENFETALHCTLLELADLIGVSDASIVRFCKSIGYTGFQEFKINAALETVPSAQQYHPGLQQYDTPQQICHKIFSTEIQALQKSIQALDIDQIEASADALRKADRVVFVGTGGSMIVAKDAYHKFLKIGINTQAAEDKDIQLMEVSLLKPGDVVFAISHSGNNIHVVKAAKLGKCSGATVVALTVVGKTSLARVADHTITTIGEPTIFRSESGSTRLAQLAVIDSLVAIMALSNYEYALDAIYKTREATSDNKI